MLSEDPGSERVGGNHEGRVTIVQFSNLTLKGLDEHRKTMGVLYSVLYNVNEYPNSFAGGVGSTVEKIRYYSGFI